MDTLGKRIKTARGKMSQDYFSNLLKISKGSLGFYERDENLPNTSVVLKICSETGVGLEWLMTGQGPMRPGEEKPTNTPHREHTQPCEITSKTQCIRCERLEEELAEERRERRELSAELREVNAENRKLAKENGELIREVAGLKKRKTDEEASLFDERRNIPSSDDVLQRCPPNYK